MNPNYNMRSRPINYSHQQPGNNNDRSLVPFLVGGALGYGIGAWNTRPDCCPGMMPVPMPQPVPYGYPVNSVGPVYVYPPMYRNNR